MRNVREYRKDVTKVIHDYFDTLDDLLSHVENGSKWSTNSDRAPYRETPSYSQQLGGATMAETVANARKGIATARDQLADLRDLIQASTSPAPGPSFDMDVAGQYPVPALAAAGDPLSMVNNQVPVQSRVRPIVRLVLDTAVAGAYSGAEIYNFGSAFLAVMDALEANNFRVELDVAETGIAYLADNLKRQFGGADRLAYIVSTNVKKASEQPDIGRIGFAVASPGMQRRICWGAYEQRPELQKPLPYYGAPWNTNDAPWIDHDQIYVPGANMLPPGQAVTPMAAYLGIIPRLERILMERGIQLPPTWGGVDRKGY